MSESSGNLELKSTDAVGNNSEHEDPVTNTSSGARGNVKTLSHEEKLKFVREPGWAPIKQEYLDLDHKKRIVEDYLPKQTVEHLKRVTNVESTEGNCGENDSEPPKKKQKLKGRNKQRPRDERVKICDRLCPSIVEERECTFKEKCKYSHDVNGYLSNKLPDLGDTCYKFETYGKCNFGITCRFGSKHLDKDNKNLQNDEIVQKWVGKQTLLNVLPKEVQQKLWKRKYDFAKANRVIREVIKNRQQKQETQQKPTSDVAQNCDKSESTSTPEDSDVTHSDVTSRDSLESSNKGDTDLCISKELQEQSAENVQSSTQNSEASDSQSTNCDTNDSPTESCQKRHSPSGAITDEGEIKIRPEEKKKIDFTDKLYLAPLTTVGNLPFRRIVKEFGVDITCSEMAIALNLLQGSQSEWALLKKHPSEDIFGAQLCGSFPDTMTRCAQLLSETVDIDFIDINLGCPIDFIFKRGEGSAMMSRTGKLEQVVRGMTGVTDLPITAKIRTGIFEDKFIAHNLVPKLRDWGVALTTIHGRSREQRYTKLADWDYINRVAVAGKPMPIYGNGDILSFEDANRRREQTGVSGLMIARGALIKPWIFTEIKEQRHWDISASERFDMLKRYSNYGLEHWGSDTEGVAKTRRFLLEWLSFLHRYVPVGLLERLPQCINEKPPHYFGRNDLETLLASGNCGDWIKISEMLLGPVPDSFAFLPKHKAAAYN